MSMPNKFILFKKTYALLLWLYPIINRIPKSHRLILGRKIEELSISLLILIIQANKSRGKERQLLQSNFSNELDMLRIFIRLTKDLKLMSIKQYISTSKKLNELGRMLNGWMKM